MYVYNKDAVMAAMVGVQQRVGLLWRCSAVREAWVRGTTVGLRQFRSTSSPVARHGSDEGNGGGGGGGGQKKKLRMEEIGKIIAVSSGKGGVGKSTVAANLAVALQRMGKSVGLLDADIYGPSVPTLMGLAEFGKPRMDAESNQVIPMMNHGVACMSMGLLVPGDQAIVWRGPMVMAAVGQLLTQVRWGKLDFLVIDLPPGTGDIKLTLCQDVRLDGAVIVSTPQDVALADVVRGADMFRKVNVPILGVVENMSYYHCPKCHHQENIFGHGGAQHTAEASDIEFLGGVPLELQVRLSSDEGRPIVSSNPESPSAKQFISIANKIVAKLDDQESASGPRIVV